MSRARILVVDDDSFVQTLLEDVLSSEGYSVSLASNGQEAMESVSENPPDLVLLDIIMPKMDGWAVIRELKQEKRFSDIPVIMQSGLDSSEDFERGLAEGAYHFVTKPLDEARLLPIVKSAIDDHENIEKLKGELRSADDILGLTKEWKVRFRTLEQAASLSKLVAKVCSDPGRVITGFSELFINAVEHGIADITYDEKSELKIKNRWEEEVEYRLGLEENIDKYANISLQKNKDNIEILIQDPGNGFEWQEYLEFSVERITDSHGRGIAMAKATSFDSLQYSGIGNEVTVMIHNNL
ncbi:MAG: response regulator [Pseudomonadales bacterium]|nr:response regulator [Pseudomonadales bacterium]